MTKIVDNAKNVCLVPQRYSFERNHKAGNCGNDMGKVESLYMNE